MATTDELNTSLGSLAAKVKELAEATLLMAEAAKQVTVAGFNEKNDAAIVKVKNVLKP